MVNAFEGIIERCNLALDTPDPQAGVEAILLEAARDPVIVDAVGKRTDFASLADLAIFERDGEGLKQQRFRSWPKRSGERRRRHSRDTQSRSVRLRTFQQPAESGRSRSGLQRRLTSLEIMSQRCVVQGPGTDYYL